MTRTEHDRWSEDLAAYMLGALEADEAAELERHAEDCERCRSEMRWLTAAVAALPEAVERLEPPPRLRDRVLTEVRADARAAGVKTASAEGGFRRRVAAWLRRPSAGSRDWRPLAGLAAVAMVVVALSGYEIGGGGSDSGGPLSTVVSGHSPGVTAKVVREGDAGELRLADVKKLPEDRVLEAWVRRDGEVEPVKALFVPDREGNASTTIGDMRGVDLVMVTKEPTGGSQAPTSSPIVSVPIPQ
ncbi:MAG TPA: anti-sigma factor [Solirubrobacterales bacterium]|nr:anti-sigma factor [Solirubrobacterales bacterium]